VSLRRRATFHMTELFARRFAAGALMLLLAGTGVADMQGADQWRHYGRTLSGTRYSPVAQITAANADGLEVAWTYRTGDLPEKLKEAKNLPAFEATPLKVGDALFLCTPTNVVISLDADTGKERWRHDPRTDTKGHYLVTCRGVAYHESKDGPEPCRRRIIAATLDGRLLALDADSGTACRGFGVDGTVSLKEGQGKVEPGYYAVTSAPTVAGDVVIVGGLVLDGIATDMPSGVVRAFDAVTGKLRWAWDSGSPGPVQLANQASYSRGSANAWSGFSADESLGLVYVPTGNRAPDYFGGKRLPHEERYSSSVVALEIATGKLRWAFQTVHHDLWDYDVASQPVLVDMQIHGAVVPVLIQPTKQGQVFVLDRRTGDPVSRVEERTVPRGTVAGERVSATQPFSVEMPSLHPMTLSESDIWGLTALDRALCLKEFNKHRHEGLFTPPSTQGTVTYPSNLGASSWGSVAVDEARQIMIANTNRIASIVTLIPRDQVSALQATGEYVAPQTGTPFGVHVTPFLSAIGVPCTPPPWGALTAVDLRTKKVLWEQPLGTTRDLNPLGVSFSWGVPNQGGGVTGGGVIFIGATSDNYLRAIDILTGREIWRGRLPAGGQATPMTYVSERSGRQFVVIAAGGHKHLGTTLGDYVIAYALPAKPTRP
jgi:quinoprotein glucose dehydrogenase